MRGFLFLFLVVNIVFSQKNINEFELLNTISNQICQSSKKDFFCKAFKFYKEKKYDSCYVYSSRALFLVDSQDEKDILNYIQGGSALKKNIFKKASENFSQISDTSSFKSLKLLQLGVLNLNIKKYKTAIEYYSKWERDSLLTKKSLRLRAYRNFGICYMHIKDFEKAKKYFDKEFSLINTIDTLSIIKAKMDLANVYYEQYLDDEAIPLFKESYDLAKLFSDIEMKQFTSQNMAVIEKNRKSYKESVAYYTEFNKWKDSLNNRDRIWELTEKDKQLAVAQKQQEIAVQDEKLKRQKVQRDGLIIGASGLLIFLGGLGFFYKKLQSQNKLITKQKEALNTANKTKDYLFSVVSHDLRSPINTIKNQHVELKEHIANNNLPAIQEVNNKAIAVTESTSHLLNNVLHWSLEQSNQLLFNPQEIALRPTIEHVLYDYRMLVEANNIIIDADLENALINADKESIKIVLRNVLDNAVKYGGKEILVTTGVSSNDYAFIKIKDSGVGVPAEKLKKINSLTNLSIDKIDRSEGVGLGVILCHTLVKKNKGILTFASEPNNGTEVTIELPNTPV